MSLTTEQKNSMLSVKIAENPSLTDQELFDLLSVKDIDTIINLPVRKLEIYLVSKGMWLEFKRSTEDSVEIARDALAMFEPEINCIEQYAMFDSLLQSLVDAPLFSFNITNKSEVLEMAHTVKSWAELNINDLTIGDIMRARI